MNTKIIDRDYLEKLTNRFDSKQDSPYPNRRDDALNLILILQHLKMDIYDALKEGNIDKAKKAWDRYNRLGWRITKLANTAVNKGYQKEVRAFIETANSVSFWELIQYDDTKVDWIEDLDNPLASTITITGKRYLKRITAKVLEKIEEKYVDKKIDWDKVVI